MALGVWRYPLALLFVSAATASDRQANCPSGTASAQFQAMAERLDKEAAKAKIASDAKRMRALGATLKQR